jgi:flagellin
MSRYEGTSIINQGGNMSLIINHNMMAQNTATNLSNAYGRLSNSIKRLSTGLRVNSAADDAAGLAVREEMRSKISTINQGVRNAENAISMIQTAEGAMSVIDEKLIRMKELAEQAATGTYTDAQRLIMQSEFSAMAAEIDRIATSTEFNGVKLLDGSASTSAGTTEIEGLPNTSALWSNTSAGGWSEVNQGIKIHFGAGNDRASDYYYVSISDMRTHKLFGGSSATAGSAVNAVAISTQHSAQLALTKIDSAITIKDTARANLGAVQNRLENTITAQSIYAENLQAAESRISDVDVAQEMTEFVRNQVLTQSAVAMLAQANSLPQMALRLLG